MTMHKRDALKIYTTPKELREIADRLERMWERARIGDDVPMLTEYTDRSDIIFVIDQQNMERQ